jgi:hypothetical protein
MKALLRHTAATGLLLLASQAHAQESFTYDVNGFLFSQGDFNADSRRDLVLVDRLSGAVRLVTQQASGAMTWGEAQPSGIDQPEALSVSKFYGPNNDAIAIGSSVANRIHLFGLTNPAEIFSPQVIYPSAPGPSSLAAFDIDATGSMDLLAIGEGLAPLTNKGRGKVYEGIAALTSTPATTWTSNFGGMTERINPLRPRANAPLRVAEIYFTAGNANGTFYAEVVGATGLSNGLNTGSIPSDSRYTIGALDSSGLTHVVFWSPDQPAMRSVRFNEATANVFSFGSQVSFNLGAGIRQITPVRSGPAGRIAVLFSNGSTKVYDFDGATAPIEQFSITDQVTDMLLPMEAGGFLAATGLRGAAPAWRRYVANGSSYLIGSSGSIPPFRPGQQQSNILFLSAEPFVNAGVSPKLLTHFREWTTSATPGSGIAWNIQSLGYGGASQGLTGSQSVTLSSSGSGDFPLVNQYSNAVSIFSLDQKTGEDLADITFDPPPGTYPSPKPLPSYPPGSAPNPTPPPTADLTIHVAATAPGYTLRYRANPAADYQTVPASGKIGITGSLTLQVYGTKSGSRTPVRSASYVIGTPQPLTAPTSPDLDGDGLPDAWEAAFGITSPTADADNDGFNNLAEAQAGTDPNLASSTPPAPLQLSGTMIRGSESRVLRLEWPATETTAVLQQSATLSPGSWTAEGGIPVVVGNKRRVDIPLDDLSPPKMFYRLAK